MGGSDQWGPQLALAARRDLIRLDLPGFGRNNHLSPIKSIEGMAEWALDHLAATRIREFDLLGHSMGGMVVQEMVRHSPERIGRLILYATSAVGVLPGRFEPIETSMVRARQDGAETTARRIAATWFVEQEAAPEYGACADIAAKSSLNAILFGLEAMRNWSGMAHLPDVKSETLIVWGDRDRTYSWPQIEQLWTKIPNSHLAVVPGCAHAVHLEKKSFFNEILSDFLAA